MVCLYCDLYKTESLKYYKVQNWTTQTFGNTEFWLELDSFGMQHRRLLDQIFI